MRVAAAQASSGLICPSCIVINAQDAAPAFLSVGGLLGKQSEGQFDFMFGDISFVRSIS
jgi:hypothetical protein